MTSHSRISPRSHRKLIIVLGIAFSNLILLLGVTGFIATAPDFNDDPNQVAPAQQSIDGGNFVWAKAMGGNEGDGGWAITVDPAGNVYTTDYFTGTADFDPGAGTFNLEGQDGNVFISKLNSDGDFVWAGQVGGGAAHGITSDNAGNVYLTGFFVGTADFDPGPATHKLTSTGEWDVFVLKLNSDGDFVWVTQLGQAATFDAGEGIDTDSAGNVYVSGDFGGDLFVTKLGSNGNILWTKAMPGADGQGLGVVVDMTGNIYSTGLFRGTDVDFDPGPGEFLLSGTDSYGDIFICKLDGNGNFGWVKQIGGPDFDVGDEIVLDTAGNIYVTGFFADTNVDFDPGSNTFYLSSVGDTDVFVVKLDSSGDFSWAGQMGGSATDLGMGLAVDREQNVYLTGGFAGTADFDPGPGTFNLTGSGSRHIFVSKLDSGGDFVWAKQMGDADTGEGMSLALDGFRNVYFTGHFRGTVDFDPSPDTFNLTSAGFNDIFVAKLSGPPGLTFTPASGNLSLSEGMKGVYHVQLNTQPTTTVTITLTADSQVSVVPTQLAYTTLTWNQPQTVTVSAVADAVTEGAHTGTITHTLNSADPVYNGLTPLSFSITLADATPVEVYLPLIRK